jgi:ankyrin repeat protein
MSIKYHIALFALALSPLSSVHGYIDSDHVAYKPFSKAIVQNDIGAIQAILDCHPGDKQEFVDEGLHKAARAKNVGLINYFLSAGAYVDNQSAGFNWTPLHQAVHADSLECVRLLLNAGANINALTWWCQVTPLFKAVERRNLEMIKLLIQAGARLDITSYWLKYTVLHSAISANNAPIVQYLIEIGAPLNQRAVGDATPLIVAAQMGKIELVKILISCGAHITTQDIQLIETWWIKYPKPKNARAILALLHTYLSNTTK